MNRYLKLYIVIIFNFTAISEIIANGEVDLDAFNKITQIRRGLDGGSLVIESLSKDQKKIFVVAHARIFEPYRNNPQVIALVSDNMIDGRREVIVEGSKREEELLVMLMRFSSNLDLAKEKQVLLYVSELVCLVIDRNREWPW